MDGGAKNETSNHLLKAGPRKFDILADQIKETFSLPFSSIDSVSPNSEFSARMRTTSAEDFLLGVINSDGHVANLEPRKRREGKVSLVFFGEGSATFLQGGRCLPLAPDSCHLFDIDEEARFSFSSPFTQYLLRFPREKLRDFFPVARLNDMTAVRLKPTSDLFLLRSLVASSVNLSSFQLFSPGAVSALGETFLALMPSSFKSSFSFETDGREQKIIILNQVKSFMRRHLSKDLDPARIAEANGMSVRSLHQCFSKNHESVMDALWEMRLEQAKLLLSRKCRLRTGASDIACRCGFKTPEHFSTKFKARFGLSPSNCRRSVIRDKAFID